MTFPVNFSGKKMTFPGKNEKFNFDLNQLKLSMQQKNICICIRKNYKNGEFSLSHFW